MVAIAERSKTIVLIYRNTIKHYDVLDSKNIIMSLTAF